MDYFGSGCSNICLCVFYVYLWQFVFPRDPMSLRFCSLPCGFRSKISNCQRCHNEGATLLLFFSHILSRPCYFFCLQFLILLPQNQSSLVVKTLAATFPEIAMRLKLPQFCPHPNAHFCTVLSIFRCSGGSSVICLPTD